MVHCVYTSAVPGQDWRPWRTEKNEAPSKFWNSKKIDFHLEFCNNITKTGTELQRWSKKYKNVRGRHYHYFTPENFFDPINTIVSPLGDVEKF